MRRITKIEGNNQKSGSLIKIVDHLSTVSPFALQISPVGEPKNKYINKHTHTHMHTYTYIHTHTYIYTHTQHQDKPVIKQENSRQESSAMRVFQCLMKLGQLPIVPCVSIHPDYTPQSAEGSNKENITVLNSLQWETEADLCDWSPHYVNSSLFLPVLFPLMAFPLQQTQKRRLKQYPVF